MSDSVESAIVAPPRVRLEASNLCPGPLTVDRLQLWSGEIAGLSGPSGTGKTLLLRSLADLDPHEGTLLLEGKDHRELPAPQWRRRVGLVAAESAWWSDRVGDHFPEWPTELAASLGFAAEVALWSVQRLSSGEKQRLALLRTLCLSPPVLLLDEPTAALDEENARRVESLVRERVRCDGVAVLWVGHDPRQLDRICDRRWVIESGRLRPRSVA